MPGVNKGERNIHILEMYVKRWNQWFADAAGAGSNEGRTRTDGFLGQWRTRRRKVGVLDNAILIYFSKRESQFLAHRCFKSGSIKAQVCKIEYLILGEFSL